MLSRDSLKRIGIDILGFLLIIAAPIASPVPGPGGLPLLILGLSLLATNHQWAARWLEIVKKQGLNISSKIFSKDPRLRWLVDVLAIIFISAAVLLLTYFTKNIARTAAISLIISSIILILGNRERLQSIKRKIKRDESHNL